MTMATINRLPILCSQERASRRSSTESRSAARFLRA